MMMDIVKQRRLMVALLAGALAVMVAGCGTEAGLPLMTGGYGSGAGHVSAASGSKDTGKPEQADGAGSGVQPGDAAVTDASLGSGGSGSSEEVAAGGQADGTDSNTAQTDKEDQEAGQGAGVAGAGANSGQAEQAPAGQTTTGGQSAVRLDPPTEANVAFVPQQGQKLVALTFDDGPDHRYTPDILKVLKEQKVKATFFMVGTQVKKYPDMVKEIVEDGHAIGNHTQHHANLSKLDDNDIKQEIKSADEWFKETIGFVPHLVRAPYGAVSDIVKDVIQENDRELIGWTVDTRDWDGASVEAMRKNVNKNTHPGGIVLMHSFGSKHLGNTVKVLPLIIQDLTDKGYTFVTVDELLAAKELNAKAKEAAAQASAKTNQAKTAKS
ncbi:peptidoglycan/xylan/chitin deacetylase (PgdA/CDA1 family) [Paenibacillus phyllosphaerae]|uniref:Peptidoglycan/xylan/chitin deacetylase (PgdA/CDA1 family) n=1 Tax=Paenibacillus phyllosphaerae TaxID=274593 RepID=A0A7W5FP37_9BACL|nr:polysaccharide deacetylase family protein [Paenibacillus phyllosphaerae]MBB3111940.1 peptidoglycan/xylan/chitin deacetylase (PgdA/CDA1 family) [Paenibacillus phyllosphaerae]